MKGQSRLGAARAFGVVLLLSLRFLAASLRVLVLPLRLLPAIVLFRRNRLSFVLSVTPTSAPLLLCRRVGTEREEQNTSGDRRCAYFLKS